MIAILSAGRILNKSISGDKYSQGVSIPIIYDNAYDYGANNNPYALGHIIDNNTGKEHYFDWDKKGNMTYHIDKHQGNERRLCWTEDNRLQAMSDKNNGAWYNYDATGERNLKLTGQTMHVNQNGQDYYTPIFDQQTLYANPLITINDKGYTKHYFEEGRRICSKIGSGELQNINQLVGHMEMDYEVQRNIQFDGITKTYEQCMDIIPYIKTDNLHEKVVQPYEGQMNPDEPSFYYHSDHLGSASFLTDRDGYETQQLVYLPFGEDWVDMKYNTQQYDTPYKFNGKEKDEELRSNREYNNINNKYHEQTGYNNYGARYYGGNLPIWLSVDPMSDKYPHVTNYIYCSNNPVMVVDPDGRDEWEVNAAGQIKHINDTPESKKHDAFYIVDENGNRVENKFLEFNKGTVTNYSRDESKNRDIFEIKGDENAKQVFELMAGNTNKEWTHAKVGTKKSGRNVLGTDHSKSSTGIAGYLLNTGWTLREVNHNHPSGRATPSWEQKEGGNTDESRGDVPSAKHYENKFPNIKLNVYTTEHKYSPYDSFGTKDERILTGKIR